MTSAPGFELRHRSSLSTLALLTRFLTASFEDDEGPTYMIRLVSGDTYDLAKDYEEHASLIEALKQSKPPAVRQKFAAIIEIFTYKTLRI